MVYLLDKDKRLELCIRTLHEIMNTHSAEIILNGSVIRDKAYIQAKNCLDEVMKEKIPDISDGESLISC